MARVRATRRRLEGGRGQVFQFDVGAIVLPCRRDYPEAEHIKCRLIVDTGTAHTHLRRQRVWNAEALGRRWSVSGIAGGSIPATEMRTHFIFSGEQFLTATVLLLDARDRDEDGLLGLDLIRRMELDGDVAEVTLASSAAWPLAGRSNELAEEKRERQELEGCSCLVAVRNASRILRSVAAGRRGY